MAELVFAGVPYAKEVGIHFVLSDKSALSALEAMDAPIARVDLKALAEPLKAELADKVSQHVKIGESHVLVAISVLKDERTRHAGNIRADLIPDIVGKTVPKEGNVYLKFICKHAQLTAITSAVSRAFPKYNKKSKKDAPRTITVTFAPTDVSTSIDYPFYQRLSDSVRLCAELVDMPTSELHTDSYLDIVKDVVSKLPGVKLTVIQGKELEQKGFGGLWGVGKASTHLPALAILAYEPAGASKRTCFVGKGIVYDTGGLSIKDKTNMCTMKADMGGSAAILSAFQAAVLSGYKNSLFALLCLAENSVDAESTRPDDILYMYSGKSVEINNTDAEGRLVLADGVSYASKHLSPDLILDMATLTGAQLICTGDKHAAILTPDRDLELKAYDAGQLSGDWVYPILYAPELLKKEFTSDIADMKNSVKNRMNAQSSAAGHFIEDHIDPAYKGKWMHVDIAGPAFSGGRGTGFGVAFLLKLLEI